MLGENERLDLCRRELQFIGDEGRKARGVQHCAEADHLLPWQTETARRELSENIHRVRDDKDNCVFAQSSRADAVEYLREQRDIAIDEVQARFIRLAAKASRDEENVAVGGARVIAGIDALVRGESGAV